MAGAPREGRFGWAVGLLAVGEQSPCSGDVSPARDHYLPSRRPTQVRGLQCSSVLSWLPGGSESPAETPQLSQTPAALPEHLHGAVHGGGVRSPCQGPLCTTLLQRKEREGRAVHSNQQHVDMHGKWQPARKRVIISTLWASSCPQRG